MNRMMRPEGWSRRQFLGAATAAAGLAALPRASVAGPAPLSAPHRLTAAERSLRLPGRSGPTAIWAYKEKWPLVLRVPRGEIMTAELHNRLAEHTTIHWHGIRVPHAMDGVPWVTQKPVEPGESFTYRFAPPDTGTFFFHPHCNTMEALSRGLAGVLIVEDPREAGLFDLDLPLALKDWRVRPDGGFEPFSTDAGAAKAGTFGGLRTVNGGEAPTIEVAPGARVRLRLVNLDPTRVPMLQVEGAEAFVIATDGNACEPFPVAGWQIGPAMRADLSLVAPNEPGATVLVEDVWPARKEPLARLVTRGPALRGPAAEPPRLPPAELPLPDLSAATELSFDLLAGHADPELEAWAKRTGMSLDTICTTARTFWSINRKAWPGGGHERMPPPLVELKSGRTYVAELFNGTPHPHPMHLHGHTFQVLGSSNRPLPPHWADTVLVHAKERIRIAFVAGEPGDWMFHCHIIEHQETGMMGYLRVA